MHTETISFTRQLEDGSQLEISMSFRFTRTADGHMRVAVADGRPRESEGCTEDTTPLQTETRLPKETDSQYLQRLIEIGKAEPRILSRWAKHLKVSLRKLTEEKKAGRIVYVEKRETRAGNAHLITAEEMLKAVERLKAV